MSSSQTSETSGKTPVSATSSEIALQQSAALLESQIDPTSSGFSPRSQQPDRSSIFTSSNVLSPGRTTIAAPSFQTGRIPSGFQFQPVGQQSQPIRSFSEPGDLTRLAFVEAPAFGSIEQQRSPEFTSEDDPQFAPTSQRLEELGQQFEEEKEQEQVEARLPDESITAFAQELAMRGITEFSTLEFNRDILETLFDQEIDFSGAILAPNEFTNLLSNVLEVGLRQALQGGNPEVDVERVFVTVGNALQNFERNIENTEASSAFVNRAIFSAISKPGIEAINQVPADDAMLIGAIFQADMARIAEEGNLPVSEKQEILRRFQQTLLNQDTQQLLNIQKWVNENVVDTSLKAALDAQLRTNLILKRRVADQEVPLLDEGIVSQTLTPLTQSQGIVVPQNIESLIRQSLQANIFAIGNLEPRFRQAAAEDLAEKFNASVAQLNFRQIINGVRTVPVIPIRSSSGQELSETDILNRINDIVERFSQPEVRFTYFPTKAEGTPLDVNQIAMQIMRDFSPTQVEKKRTARMRISQPRSVFKIGNVTIKERTIEGRKEREIDILPNASVEDLLKLSQALIMENGTLKDINRKLLLNIVKGETTIEEILRVFMTEQKINLGKIIRISYLPASLVGGAFLDGFMAPIFSKPLNLRMGMNTNIMRIGISKLNPKGGILPVPFRKLYRPADVAHIGLSDRLKGGALPFQIQITPESMRRLEMHQQQAEVRGEQEDRKLPVGGDIFGSIFGAIGNVVKTVASVPLALAGAVFGGDLPVSARRPEPGTTPVDFSPPFVGNSGDKSLMLPTGSLIRVEG